MLARVFRAVDIAVAAVASAIVAVEGHPWAAGAWAITVLIALRALGSYLFPRKQNLSRHLILVGSAMMGGALAAFVTSLLSRPMDRIGALSLLAASLAVGALHAAWWRIIDQGRREGRLTPNIVVVGATDKAQRLIEAAMRTGEANVLGLFDDRLQRSPANILGVPMLGDTEALIGHRIMPCVDRVVIAIDAAAEDRVGGLVEKLGVLPNAMSLFVEVGGAKDDDAALARIAAGAEHPLTGWGWTCRRRAIVKRAQDLVVAVVGLVAAGPLMLAIALAVKMDSPGPVFFRQRRHGFNNEAILVWKFRSMRHEMADATASRQISANDDRVTRVGKFIRKTSLDELPQLFNVLGGEMSIVGPRPHAVGMKTSGVESAKLVARYAHRHRMKPGLTGWAAIKGSRGPVDTAECVRRRVALDVEYIERQSLWLDLYIIFMTVPCLLGDRSAVR